MMKQFIPLAAVLAAVLVAPSAVQARLNMLEPWTPGVDAEIPRYRWNHGLTLRLGSGDADLFEMAYHLSTPLNRRWEAGGSWGYASFDPRGPGKSDAGVTDLALGAKYALPESVLRRPVHGAVEMGLTLPTGDPKSGLGAGGPGVFGGLDLSVPFRHAVTGYLHTGLRLYTEGRDTRWGNALQATIGAQYAVDREWVVSGDLRVISRGRDKINGVKAPDGASEVYLVPGGEWRPRDLSLRVQSALLLGLSSDAYDLGLMAGIRF
jgi:hypothetical protein